MVIGRILSKRYEIIKQIGGGGTALVYSARDIYLNRMVAVKILREQLTSDEEFVSCFRREAQAVASLSHTNIVNIYDVGDDNGTYYLVMEIVEGRNLKEIIKEKGNLSISETVRIAEQICDAIEHAHEHNVIHRDIKPHNVLITKEEKIKVTDFGIARAVSAATITHTDSVMGSVHYFSPEQARGEISDEKSDIYSLGVVIYEMLTGRLPFKGESPISVVLNKLQNDPTPPSKINSQIGEALEKVILKAMEKEPQKRYNSVRELKEALISAHLYNRFEEKKANQVTEDTIILPKFATRKKQKSKFAIPAKLWMWIIALLLSISFAIGIYMAVMVFGKKEVKVPDIKNITVDEAKLKLKKYDLVLEVGEPVKHPTVTEGLIISQSPKVNETVKKKGKVTVTVSDGPKLVKVPRVIGETLLSAEITLSNWDFTVEIEKVYNSQIYDNIVIAQKPAADETIAKGTAVKLVVSKGPEPVYIKMPDLITLKLTEAKSAIEENHLTLGITEPEPSYKYAKNIVIRQDPSVGSEILQGTTINLVVSSGPGA
ncbi:MAG: Stk1 family PASTA domain-containing Ser/Thr kinase [Clostridia bacterium]|nr:Stk1 family PASTA domain-containing Ser/Thr kinase [Clostridia bacterium]MDD4048106.1 Stk1 family PASTA domain-containing Ser/Thr kinase [Clostridia bacterium]